MAIMVKDTSYRYIPGQDRLVNVSDYMINRDSAAGVGTKSSSLNELDAINLAVEDFGIRNIRWMENTVTVSDLLCHDQLPVIVRVARGYYGGGEQEELIVDQVLQICRSCEQRRVTAVDSRGRALSLPVNYPLRVRPLTGPQNAGHQSQLLSELLETVQLPVTVEFVDVPVAANRRPSAAHLFEADPSMEQLTLKEIVLQDFLLANSVNHGWLDQSQIHIIPDQLNAEFRMAVGVQGLTNGEWLEVRGMLSRAARHLNFDRITGYEGVIYDDWIDRIKPKVDPSSAVVIRNSPGLESALLRRPTESDADANRERNRCQLLWQQSTFSHGSLPSLPTALDDSMTTSSRSIAQSTHSGSINLSHLVSESLEPSQSTESLLPRNSVDSGVPDKSNENIGKRKSNVPSRLLRRKAEPKRLVADVLVNFDGSSSRTSDHAVSQSGQSSEGSGSKVSMQRLSLREAFNSPFSPSLQNEHLEPILKSVSRNSADSELDERTPKFRHSSTCTTSGINDTSEGTLDSPRRSSRERLVKNYDCPPYSEEACGSPPFWSSDLCPGSAASEAESEVSAMKGKKERNWDPSLSSLNHSVTSPFFDSCFQDSAQSLDYVNVRSAPSTEKKHRGYQYSAGDDFLGQRTRTYNDTTHFRDSLLDSNYPSNWQTMSSTYSASVSSGVSEPRPDYSGSGSTNPAGRNRKRTNGLVKMKLDFNGTAMSSGSEITDDGYGTKSYNSMTSSEETVAQEQRTPKGVYYF